MAREPGEGVHRGEGRGGARSVRPIYPSHKFASLLHIERMQKKKKTGGELQKITVVEMHLLVESEVERKRQLAKTYSRRKAVLWLMECWS